MLVAILLVAFGAVGILFFLRPSEVVRLWAIASRWSYRGRYKRYLEIWDSLPPGRLQRKLTRMSSSELMDEAYRNPKASPPALIAFIRSLGAVALALALVIIIAIVADLAS